MNTENCNLTNKEVLDNKNVCDVMWVDHHKEKDIYENILKNIEANLKDINFYKTNLINDFNEDIESNKEEKMQEGLPNLLKEINTLNPKIIFILGNEVADFLVKNIDYLEPTVIMINHPSYVYNFDRENIDLYISDITEIIKNKLG